LKLDERVGNLVTVLSDKELVPAVTSQLTLFIRTNYSNPPAFGSRVVAKVLSMRKIKRNGKLAIYLHSFIHIVEDLNLG